MDTLSIRKVVDDYVAFTFTTAKYPTAHTMPYLGLGLSEEVSEVFQKAYQLLPSSFHDSSRADRVVACKKEFGDVYWYAVQFADRVLENSLSDFLITAYLGMGTQSQDLDVDVGVLAASQRRAQDILGRLHGLIKKAIRDQDGVFDMEKRDKARTAFLELMTLIMRLQTYLGFNLVEILNLNQEKLTSRKERNVISGSGDDR